MSDLVKTKIPKEIRQKLFTQVILACDESPDISTIIFDPDIGGVTENTLTVHIPELKGLGKVYASRVHFNNVEDYKKALDVDVEGQDQVTLLMEEEF